MPIRSTMKGDTFYAHTWRKCSFVTEIIQHVEWCRWHAGLKSLKTPPHTVTGGTMLLSIIFKTLHVFFNKPTNDIWLAISRFSHTKQYFHIWKRILTWEIYYQYIFVECGEVMSWPLIMWFVFPSICCMIKFWYCKIPKSNHILGI